MSCIIKAKYKWKKKTEVRKPEAERTLSETAKGKLQRTPNVILNHGMFGSQKWMFCVFVPCFNCCCSLCYNLYEEETCSFDHKAESYQIIHLVTN